jgi:hypothetical protein
MLRRSAAAPRRILRFLRNFYGRVLALTPAGVTYGRSRGRRPATLSTATSGSGSRLAAGSAPDVRERTQLTPAGQTLVGECFEEIGKPLRPQDRVCRDRGRGQQHDDEVPKLHERRRQPHRAGSCRESRSRWLACRRRESLSGYPLMSWISSRTSANRRSVSRAATGHPIQRSRLRLVGDLVKPVAVGKPEEDFLQVPDGALELFDRLRVLDIQPAQGIDEPVGQQYE